MNRDDMPLGGDPRQVGGALRTQLGEISAASQLLLSRARDEDRRYLAIISRAAFRCSRLLYEGELSRRMCGEDETQAAFTTVDLVSWCREGCRRAAELLKMAEIALAFTCGETDIITQADRELLDELLYALVSNAAKAVGTGGHVSVTLSRRGDRAVLTVSDEGDGLSEAALERLLKGAGAEPDLTPGTGAGLGLRLCRAIAEDHGGLLMLETGPDAGTRAAVTLPIREGEGGCFADPGLEDGCDRAMEALSEVLPPECFML